MQTFRIPRRFQVVAAVSAAMSLATPIASLAQTTLEGGEGFAPGAAVAVIVKVPTPWYAPRFFVVKKMRETIPERRALPGLAFKAFSFARADGQFGGIYLWADLASARAWFSPAWFARVKEERGASANVRLFEVIAVIDNTPGGTPADSNSSSVATLSTLAMPAGVGRDELVRGFEAGLDEDRNVRGLLRRYFVATGDGRFGHISLWRDAASAQAWFNRATDRTVGQPAAAEVEWFDTPILLPSALPQNQAKVKGLGTDLLLQ